MPNLTIIIASTRPGRAGLPIATWFAEHARTHRGFDVTLVDLAAVNLPLLDEPEHPSLRRYRHAHTRNWSATIDAADAFVLVTCEYNHGYPAPLKNALDYLCDEWAYKPVGFVSYGGLAAGTRAMQQLKPVAASLRMFAVMEAVNIPFHTQLIDDAGALQPNASMGRAATRMLDELAHTEASLRHLRPALDRAA